VGESDATTGVYGSGPQTGVSGTSAAGAGVYGSSTGAGQGVSAYSAGGVGVWGESGSFDGVQGRGGGAFSGIVGYPGPSNGWAGFFFGRVHVGGFLDKAGGGFRIDHPLDPETRTLTHSFVESPDMKNVYDGVAVLAAEGTAVVELPAWFEALNRDFRYQLTCIRRFAPVFVAETIASNRFTIAGGTPGLEVSWQVTGTRHDAWAEANRPAVEEDKPVEERGTYLYPEAAGQPQERDVEWLRRAQGMKAPRETRMSDAPEHD
jgi:hypothetical protein